MGNTYSNKFTKKIDENEFDVRKYLFSLTEVQTEGEDNSNDVLNSREEELKQMPENLARTNRSFRPKRENKTKICMDINRPLTSDSYKILYLVYDNCKE